MTYEFYVRKGVDEEYVNIKDMSPEEALKARKKAYSQFVIGLGYKPVKTAK